MKRFARKRRSLGGTVRLRSKAAEFSFSLRNVPSKLCVGDLINISGCKYWHALLMRQHITTGFCVTQFTRGITA